MPPNSVRAPAAAVQRRGKVVGHLEPLDRVEHRPRPVGLGALDDGDPGSGHLACREPSLDADLVGPRPRAARPARREVLLRFAVRRSAPPGRRSSQSTAPPRRTRRNRGSADSSPSRRAANRSATRRSTCHGSRPATRATRRGFAARCAARHPVRPIRPPVSVWSVNDQTVIQASGLVKRYAVLNFRRRD